MHLKKVFKPFSATPYFRIKFSINPAAGSNSHLFEEKICQNKFQLFLLVMQNKIMFHPKIFLESQI